jgi:hypothetical protein
LPGTLLFPVNIKGEKVIKTYNSMSEAERENGISKGKISAVIQGHRKTAGGYKWTCA